MSWWQRIGGPNGITFIGWLLLAPISIIFTIEVVPEGYLSGWSRIDGYILGTLSHVATGLVLLLGKFLVLPSLSKQTRPFATVLIMGLAGLLRGFSTAWGLEFFGVTAAADYLDRMASGAALIIIWFTATAVVIDSRSRYRTGFQELAERLEQQRLLRARGNSILTDREAKLVNQVRSTLNDALKQGAKTSEIHDAVDLLVRPLAHDLASSRPSLEAVQPKPKIRIKFLPIMVTAFEKTPYSFGPVIFVSVLGTFYSKLWQLGWLGLVDSILSAGFIWFFFALGSKLDKFGWWAWVFWLSAGLASAVTTGFFSGVSPLENPMPVFYLSLNILIPALLVAFLRAYDYEANRNLGRLDSILESLRWETIALQQQAWVQQKRIARFVHSDLQARIRAFALRLELSGSQPKAEDIEQLRLECEMSLALGGEYQDFEKFIAELKDLWEGIAQISFQSLVEVRGQVAADPFAQIALIEIVREAVTNAVKHGRASKIDVSVEQHELGGHQNLMVEVKDNGQGKKQGGQGLGSSVLTELTLSWSLETTDLGATLRAVVPVRQLHPVS